MHLFVVEVRTITTRRAQPANPLRPRVRTKARRTAMRVGFILGHTVKGRCHVVVVVVFVWQAGDYLLVVVL